MKTQMLIVTGLLAVMPLAGCATCIESPDADVHLTSQPAGADVIIRNARGETVFAGTTPAVASLKRGSGYFRPASYTVSFTKAGCETVERKIKRGISAWYLGGNFLFGGWIGWLVVDPLTGAMWTLEKNCSAQLPALATSSTTDENRLHVVRWNDGPDDLKTHLRRVD